MRKRERVGVIMEDKERERDDETKRETERQCKRGRWGRLKDRVRNRDREVMKGGWEVKHKRE